MAPPTYQQYAVDQFINIKSVSGFTVYGDGVTDDTANINSILSTYANCKMIFFPQGTYLVTNTILIPAGSRIVGEVWSAISAVGSNFYNPTSPVPMVQVGNAGDVGVAQISDMLFTVADVLQGCQLVSLSSLRLQLILDISSSLKSTLQHPILGMWVYGILISVLEELLGQR